MKLNGMDQVEAWETNGALLGLGWHEVEILSADDSETSTGGHPQWIIDFGNAAGTRKEWLVVVPATMGKLKALLDAAAVPVKGGDWELTEGDLKGKTLQIYVGSEPKYDNPRETVLKIKGYRPAGTPITEAEQGAAADAQPVAAGGGDYAGSPDGDDIPW